MRELIAFVLVLAGLWSGYWFVGSTAKHQVITAWLDARRADGWTAEFSDFQVVGFPNRFDSRFTDLHLFDPRSGIEWMAPEFDILALSYQPNHIIAVWPPAQNLGFPLETVSITNSRMVASVVFEPDTKLAIDRTSLEIRNLELQGGSGWQTSIGSLILSTRQHPNVAFAHDVVFDAKSLHPTVNLLQTLDPAGTLPMTIEALFLDVQLDFDAPWDRIAVEEGAPLVIKITVNRMTAAWGKLGLDGKGVLNVSADGRISGTLDVALKNWPAVIDLFASSGAISAYMAATIKSGLGLFASGSEEDPLATTLTLEDGFMKLGPITIGPAPRFIRS